MSDSLKKLIGVARRVSMNAEQREQQRRSFAYGNTNIENGSITKSMINEQAIKLMQKNG